MTIAKRGFFISVEGGEGVGKSDFCERLAKCLVDFYQIELVKTREPGGSPSAEMIRKIFSRPATSDPLSPISELFLISAARKQHLDHLVRPKLDQGAWVLCDRFYDSTRVYQGSIGGLDRALIEQMIGVSTSGLNPDLSLFLDCDVRLASERLEQRSHCKNAKGEDGAIRFDRATEEIKQKMRDSFLDLSRKFPKRIVVLDASASREHLVERAMSIIAKRLKP